MDTQKMPDLSTLELKTKPSGLKYCDLEVGEGAEIKTGQKVVMNYSGWLENGKMFDSSYSRGETFSFNVGIGMVIKGWDEGVPGMKEGGFRILVIPSHLGYGDAGVGPIPGGATLVFLVEAVKAG